MACRQISGGGRAALAASGFFQMGAEGCHIVGMQIKVYGSPPAKGSFLVANHLGNMDIAAFAATFKFYFVAKSEVRGWFAIGKLADDMGTVFIDRQNRRDILRANSEIRRKFDESESLVLFPEATSCNGEQVLSFKSSMLEFASENNFPVSYASITYRTSDKNTKAGDEVCWWGEADFLPHLWRLFQIKNLEAVVTFGGEPLTGVNRKELATSLQRKISEILRRLPISN